MTTLTKEIIEGLLEAANKKQNAELNQLINASFAEVDKKLKRANERIKRLEKDRLFQERRLRRNNVVLFGIEAGEGDLAEFVLSKIDSLLGIKFKKSEVNNIYKIGRNPRSPIVVEFVSFYSKLSIFSEKERLKNLKGTGITLANDLCKQDRIDRKVLVKHLIEARQKNIPARIRGYRLEIQGQLYTASQLEQNGEESEVEYETVEDSESESIDGENAVSQAVGLGELSGTKDGTDKKRKTQSTSPKDLNYRTRQQKKSRRH